MGLDAVHWTVGISGDRPNITILRPPGGRAGYRYPQPAVLWPIGRRAGDVMLFLAAGAAVAALQVF